MLTFSVRWSVCLSHLYFFGNHGIIVIPAHPPEGGCCFTVRDMMKLTVLIAQLFLIKFLIFLSVSYRSYDLGKSDFFYHPLWMLLPWQFQLRLAFAKPYDGELLHHWPGRSPNLNLIENCWRSVPIIIFISFRFDFIPFYPIPFHSYSTSDSNFDHLSLNCHSSQTNKPILMCLASIACMFQALYDTYQKNQKLNKK